MILSASEPLPGMVWTAQADGRITSFSSAWLNYTGLDAAAARAGGWQACVYPKDLPGFLAYWATLLNSGSPAKTEVRLRRHDGSYRWFLLQAEPRTEHGQVSQWHGQMTDIDDLKCAEALLAGEKMLLEMIANSSPIDLFLQKMCAVVDQISPDSLVTIGLRDHASGRLLHTITPNLPAAFGSFIDGPNFSPEAFPCAAALDGTRTLAITDIEASHTWPIYRQLAMQYGLRACFITPIVASDGEVLGTFNLHALKPGEATTQQRAIIEQFTHLVAVAVKRKRIDDALQASQERFSLAAQASAEGIWDWDIDKNEMFMSVRAQRIYGITPGETIRRRQAWRSEIRLHPDDVAAQALAVEQYLQGIAPAYDGEWRILAADGRYRWVRICGLCVRNSEGKATRLAGSVSDIDTQKRVEAALEQSRRLEALGTLAGGIAHDFNNILGVIIGYGEMALRDVPASSRLYRDLDNIMHAGQRGRALANRILAFSRSGSLERVAVNVQAVVAEAIDMLNPTLPAGITIDTHLNAAQAAMLGDPTQVHQLVMNLCTNAIQAMQTLQRDGSVRVSLLQKSVLNARVSTTGLIEPGNYLILQVADNGCGIASDIVDRIFDPFFTTKEVGVGTGLGLSLVHGIVAELGGAIDVTSAVNAGSTFSVYLPRAGELPTARETHAPPSPRGASQHIAIVDDEAALTTLAAETLMRLGYVVSAFVSASDALAAIQADPMRYDLLLTDERMPVMHGSVLAQTVRRLRPDLPVLLMSGYTGDTAASGVERLANAILAKPFTASELATMVAQVLHQAARG